jgi:hypothetical protein
MCLTGGALDIVERTTRSTVLLTVHATLYLKSPALEPQLKIALVWIDGFYFLHIVGEPTLSEPANSSAVEQIR